MLLISEETTREDIIEALRHRNYGSKRQQCLIGTPECPTPWDVAHADMDELIAALLDRLG